MRFQNTVEPSLRDTVMITQNVTLSNAEECNIQTWNKSFNPGLTLIGLPGTRSRSMNIGGRQVFSLLTVLWLLVKS